MLSHTTMSSSLTASAQDGPHRPHRRGTRQCCMALHRAG